MQQYSEQSVSNREVVKRLFLDRRRQKKDFKIPNVFECTERLQTQLEEEFSYRLVIK